MLDKSEVYVKELNHAIVNLYKLCLEEMGYDLGDTNNKIEYHNYLYQDPMYFDTKDDSTKYDKDAAYKGFSPEELEFIKNLNIQEGGEGLDHVGRFDSKDKFVKTIYNAFRSKGVSSVIALCMTAQAAIESAWGTSHYASYSNYGGINYHRGADFVCPGKSAHGHSKAGYRNVGRYVEEKLGIMERLYPGATSADTPEKYFSIIQGGNPNHYCYGGENEAQRRQYGKLVMGVMSSVEKYLS